MIFSLVQDFADALAELPPEHACHRMLTLLDEAIRRDVHFIERHPTTLFQCLWNTCSWESANDPDTNALAKFLNAWRTQRIEGYWVRSLHPPEQRLGGPLYLTLNVAGNCTPCVYFSLDSRTLLLGDSLGLGFWDLTTGVLQRRLSLHTDYSHLHFSADGQRFLVGYGGSAQVIDSQSGSILFQHEGPEQQKGAAALSGDGTQVFISDMKEVHIYDLATKQRIKSLGLTNIQTIVVADNGPRVALATQSRGELSRPSEPPWVYVYDQAAQSEIQRFPLVGGTFYATFSPDLQWVAARAAEDRLTSPDLLVFHVETGKRLGQFKAHQTYSEFIYGLAVSSKGNLVAAGTKEGYLCGLNLQTNKSFRLAAHSDKLTSLAISPDGRWVATTGPDFRVHVWCTELLYSYNVDSGIQDDIHGVTISRDGQWFGLRGRAMVENNARFGKVHHDEPLLRIHHEKLVFALAFSPDAKQLAVAPMHLSNNPCTWDVATNQQLENAIFPEALKKKSINAENVWDDWYQHEYLLSLAFSPSGKYLAGGAMSDAVNLFRCRPLRFWRSLANGHGDRVVAVAFASDDRHLVSGSSNGKVCLWNIHQRKPLLTFNADDVEIVYVGFVKRGQQIVTGSKNRVMRLWDRRTGQLLEEFAGLGDLDESYADPSVRAFQALEMPHETIIRDRNSGLIIGWFPISLQHIAASPIEPLWIGAKRHQFFKLRLEGPVRIRSKGILRSWWEKLRLWLTRPHKENQL